MNKVQADTKHQVAALGIPSTRGTPFPLKPLVITVLDIQSQLVGIKQRIASVEEAKSLISSKAQDLLVILQHSQSQWMDKVEHFFEEPILKSCAVFNAGV